MKILLMAFLLFARMQFTRIVTVLTLHKSLFFSGFHAFNSIFSQQSTHFMLNHDQIIHRTEMQSRRARLFIATIQSSSADRLRGKTRTAVSMHLYMDEIPLHIILFTLLQQIEMVHRKCVRFASFHFIRYSFFF